MRHLTKPTFVRIYPRARIIFRKGVWLAHVIEHPIEKPDDHNLAGYAARSQLAFAHDQSARVVRDARARQEQP